MGTLRFHDGTLLLEGVGADALPPGFVWDGRVRAGRAPGHVYADTVRAGRAAGLSDEAKAWSPLELEPRALRSARPYQAEALAAWEGAGRRGVVVLPTGAGKSFVAEQAILACARPALVVAPTLDLVSQWVAVLRAAFGLEPGVLGGGHHEVRPLTVSTYDSAMLHAPRYGDRFGLVVFDEVHHLPAPGYRRAAESLLAPWRLGLTATYERADGAEQSLDALLGPVVYRREIHELAGDWLATYEAVQIPIRLGRDERAAYDAARKVYTSFIGRNRVPVSRPGGWEAFVRMAARSKDGRAAMRAWHEARRIQHGSDRKLEVLAALLQEEHGRRALVFTHDNATAYRVSEALLLPCITHQTDVKERRALLDAFSAGTLPVLVTSRVLNEGVDLPEAEVAIVLSGSDTVREHVQRLGRILRPRAGKQATLYELVAADTAEVGASQRRREHDAYR